MHATASPTLRELARESVRSRIADVAIDLFAEHGFDEVTVGQIAAEVGISARSFNRYFPTKEDAVIGDAARWGQLVAERLASRPATEQPWHSLRESYAALFEESMRDARPKRTILVVHSTASLRARNLEKHVDWARLLVPIISERLEGDKVSFRAEVLVHTSLVCLDLGIGRWARDEGKTPALHFIDEAFSVMNP